MSSISHTFTPIQSYPVEAILYSLSPQVGWMFGEVNFSLLGLRNYDNGVNKSYDIKLDKVQSCTCIF